MWFLVVAATVASIFGFLFLFFPKVIRRLNKNMSKTFNRVLANFDEKVYNLRIGIGVCLLMFSATAIFVVYYLIRKY